MKEPLQMAAGPASHWVIDKPSDARELTLAGAACPRCRALEDAFASAQAAVVEEAEAMGIGTSAAQQLKHAVKTCLRSALCSQAAAEAE